MSKRRTRSLLGKTNMKQLSRRPSADLLAAAAAAAVMLMYDVELATKCRQPPDYVLGNGSVMYGCANQRAHIQPPKS